MKPEYEGVITQKPDDAPRVRGTRITVYDVMDYYTRDREVSYIADVLRLTEPDVLAAIAYIQDHREEVDAAYAKILERDARGNPPEIQAMLAQSREKALAWRGKLEARGAAAATAGERDAATTG